MSEGNTMTSCFPVNYINYYNKWANLLTTKGHLNICISCANNNVLYGNSFISNLSHIEKENNIKITVFPIFSYKANISIKCNSIVDSDLFICLDPYDESSLQELTLAIANNIPYIYICKYSQSYFDKLPNILSNSIYIHYDCSEYKFAFENIIGSEAEKEENFLTYKKCILQNLLNTNSNKNYIFPGFIIEDTFILEALIQRCSATQDIYLERETANA